VIENKILHKAIDKALAKTDCFLSEGKISPHNSIPLPEGSISAIDFNVLATEDILVVEDKSVSERNLLSVSISCMW
jgi:hypothetical protein